MLSAIWSTLLLLLAFVPVATALPQGSAEDYARVARLADAARKLPGASPVRPNWMPNGRRFWYVATDSRGNKQWVLVDPADPGPRRFSSKDEMDRVNGSTTALVRLPTLAAVPESRGGTVDSEIVFENATGKPVVVSWAENPKEFRAYATLPPKGRRAQHSFAGHVWVAHDTKGTFLGAWRVREVPSSAVIDGSFSRAASSEPKRSGGESPNGRWRASVRDNNVWLEPAGGGGGRYATTDGRPDDRYDASTITWSPDSQKLVVFRTEPAQQRAVHLLESTPTDQLQPKLRTLDYLKPGDRIAHPRPVLVDLVSGTSTPIADNLFPNPWSLTRLGKDPWADGVTWAGDSSAFWFVYNERGHQRLRVVRVEASTAKATVVIEETSPTFVDYANKFCALHLEQYGAILWMSERDGWNHLYLFDAVTGGLRNRVTSGEWLVREVDRVDEQGRVWFQAMGIRPGQDPYHVHWARVGVDGRELAVLTEGDGTHRVEFSPDRSVFVDTWSRVDRPPVVELRRSSDGSRLMALEQGDARALQRLGLRPPERFVAKGRDGKTDIWGVIHRPSHFDARKRYPVVEQIYAGPQGHFVPKAWSPWHGEAQALAELGFIVVQIDGMGTNWRRKSFHDTCWRNLKDAGFPDRIAWIRAAAKRYPSFDLTRVGIYGGSAGGQNALAALIWHGDFYHAAVADCGCHDNRMDKIWWNELWMGWPVGDHYAANSNTVHAAKLTGKLLLVVGELDSNVDPATTMQVAATLVKADKDFDLLILPGAGHGAAETPYGRRRRRDFLVRHLLRREPRWTLDRRPAVPPGKGSKGVPTATSASRRKGN